MFDVNNDHPVSNDNCQPSSREASTSSAGDATPVHPKFSDLEERLDTFRDQFNPLLADFGFFVEGQSLKCFSCGLTLNEVMDDIIVEHLLKKPNCAHARFIHTLQRMQSLSERLKSFEGSNHGSKESLARAGFFHRKEDGRTQCAYCRIIVDNWHGVESIFDQHARLALTCPFVLNPPDYALEKSSKLKSRGNVVIYRRAQYSNMTSPDARLQTFDEWPGVVDKHQLVDAGFFYMKDQDLTKCFHCGGALCQWQSNDDPWQEHARWYPECEYVRLVRGYRFVEQVLAMYGDSHSRMHREDSIEKPLPAALELELQLILDRKDLQPHLQNGTQTNTLRVALKSFMVKNQRGFSSSEELASLLNSTLQLNSPTTPNLDMVETPDETICVICSAEKRGAVFLPCGHMVTCQKCAASVPVCPVCRGRIEQIVRTYLS